MSGFKLGFLLVSLGLFGMIGAASIAAADTLPSDRGDALARIDARIAELRRDMVTGPRMGAMERHGIRRDLRGLKQARQTIGAGGTVEDARLAALLDVQRVRSSDDPAVLEQRLERQREAVDRRLARNVPKLGALERLRLRSEVEQLDSLIADLERGEDVDLARVDRLITVMRATAPTTPAERLRSLEVQRAVNERKLGPGPRIGARERERLRDEIEALDAMIEELESGL